MPSRSPSALLPLAAFVLALGLVVPGLGLASYGFDADEVEYFQAARLHVEWLADWGAPDHFSAETLDRHFPWNPRFGVIHPAFSRLLSGATWAAFHEGLGLDELSAARLSSALAYAGTAVVLVVLARRLLGSGAAVVALLLLLCDPRFFAHAHLAKTDMVLTFLWLWATARMVAWRPENGLRPVVATAFLVGLGLATKLPAVILWMLFLGWILLPTRGRRPGLLAAALAIPPVIFYALTPQAWHHPLSWTAEFLRGFTEREEIVHIPTFFQGQLYEHRLPWYAPTVHGWITTPPAISCLAIVFLLAGLAALLRRSRATPPALSRAGWCLLAASGFATLAALSLPGVPAHDCERLFLPLHPFLALFAAGGFGVLVRVCARPGPPETRARRAPHAGALLGVLILVPAAGVSLREHPYELVYFNTFVGGAPGAEAGGYDVAYSKAEVNQGVLTAVEQHLEPHATLFSNFLQRDLVAHQEAGRLRADLRLPERLEGTPEYVLLYARRSWMLPQEEKLYLRRPPPLWKLHHRGVDVVLLYRMADVQTKRQKRRRRGDGSTITPGSPSRSSPSRP